MRTPVITVFSTLLLTAVSVSTGCDAPDEPEDQAERLEDDALLLQQLESDDPELVIDAIEALSTASFSSSSGEALA